VREADNVILQHLWLAANQNLIALIGNAANYKAKSQWPQIVYVIRNNPMSKL